MHTIDSPRSCSRRPSDCATLPEPTIPIDAEDKTHCKIPSMALWDRLRANYGLFRASRWTREELLSYQAACFRRIARHASRNVPFYAGIDVEDVTRLPIIQKSDIQREPSAFLARGLSADRLVWYVTSGSTGEPIRIYRSMVEERLLQAYRIRAELMLGMRLTDRRAAVLFTGVPRNQRRIAKPPATSRLGILPRTVIDNTDSPDEIIARLRQVRPHVVIGHPGSLGRVADALDSQDRELIRPRFVVTGAEMLHQETRRRIEGGFQARVYDFYGAHECNLVGWQCPRREGFHLAEDNVIVEILRAGKPVGPGEEGEVVITTLHSYAMPFLRYKLGDVVVRGEPCPCGLPFATVAKFQGRAADVAYLSDGSTMGTIPIANAFLLRVEWIRQFQVIQTEPGKLSAYIIPHRAPEQADEESLEAEFQSRWGLILTHHLVDEVPVRPAGKMPVFVNRVERSGRG